MHEFIKLLDLNYELKDYHIKKNIIVFKIHSTKIGLKCPYCGSVAKHMHSTYQREIQDLPIQDNSVVLLVDTRKMFCSNPCCSHKTFSENHPFVARRGKKTNRLIKNIIYTSTQLSSLSASKLLKSENITVCKSSIVSAK